MTTTIPVVVVVVVVVVVLGLAVLISSLLVWDTSSPIVIWVFMTWGYGLAVGGK